jgi:hypothetical protein
MHFVLFTEVPIMTLVPEANYQFTAVEKTRFAKFWCRISFVPNHELKCVKYRIKDLMPLSD